MKLVREANLVRCDRQQPDAAPAMDQPQRLQSDAGPSQDPVQKQPLAAAAATLPRQPPTTTAEAMRPDPASTACFDGRWVGLAGDWMGTISGLSLQWADGPLVAIKILSDNSFACDLSAQGVTETFSAQLDAQHCQLLW